MHIVIALFVPIFMKFSPKCRTKKFGMIYTILGSFCSFFIWEGADIQPQIRPRKITGSFKLSLPRSAVGWSVIVALPGHTHLFLSLGQEKNMCGSGYSTYPNSFTPYP